ncbi:hypothetical protein RE428_30680 [Marinobacter nanhaiticus D15-8W]|nr:hypothetical protein RE428_30680 [Marinobacter nanhaiticus D15-8W]
MTTKALASSKPTLASCELATVYPQCTVKEPNVTDERTFMDEVLPGFTTGTLSVLLGY